ncbi:aromatic ring-hydroxylating oxygenase subunit alpha [Rhodococcus opacus]|uniref:aromatic ring-hydroxylating oxygenase subunit alpha n=1 Tax=Rhodococcus opacus TaxID=37919 RepID=UPI002474B018|nr:aromatic ring-hydroxylating dioxygenase subunit alpha [Rhodococcus opacus]MDH6288235.1 phenylpropionate dioxygenase-like ring-hydroxylating dioxygenase large terminal subunit [Rhodococcus opacus]
MRKTETMPPDDLDFGALISPDCDRVHTSLYSEDAVFTAELERIWKSTWLYVGHESEVAEPGDYITRLLATQPVILTRDQDESLHVLVNRCTHRGNTVCHQTKGNSNTFRCAYHGWSFANDGAVVGFTYSDEYGDALGKADFGLKRLPRVESYRGFVFASFNEDVVSLRDHLGPATEYLDHFVDLAPAGTVNLRAGNLASEFDANWKMPAENAVDGYHAVFLHQAVIKIGRDRARKSGTSNARLSSTSRKKQLRTRDLGNGHAMLDFSEANRSTPIDSETEFGFFPRKLSAEDNAAYRRDLADRLGADRAELAISSGLSNLLIFPNLALVGPDVRVIVPLGPGKTRLLQFPALLDGAPADMNEARIRNQSAAYGPAGMVGPDDIEIYCRNQRAFYGPKQDWVVLARGATSEEINPDGSRVGVGTGETSQRAFWRKYRELMMGEA